MGECWGECKGADEGEVCCLGPSEWSEWRLTQADSPGCPGGGGGGDTLINDCIRKDCDTVNFSPGNLFCIEQWQRPDGSTYEKQGVNTGETCGTASRSPAQVCSQFGGQQTSTCIADPNCGTNGGVCCDKSSTNYCCYGDSQTRQDGACYAGGQQPEVTCSGRTITNNTQQTMTVLRFTGSDNQCPFESPAGEKTLAPGATLTASCEQLEVSGKCGVCDDSACGGGGGPPPPTPTPTPAVTAQCREIKAYDTSWNLLDAAKLSQLKTGNIVRFAVLGQTNTGTISKARFRVNTGTWQETTTKKPGTEEFYTEYTLPAGLTSFKVEAEVFHSTLGWL